MRIHGATAEDEARAELRGMSLEDYVMWRAKLRREYKVLTHVPSRLSQWRGPLRAWMVPGSDATTIEDEVAA